MKGEQSMLSLLQSVRRFGSASRILFSGALAVSGMCLASPLVAQDAANLAGYLPDDINAVAVVRVKETLSSPKAIKENWAEVAEANFLKGDSNIPTWVDTLVIGYLVRPATSEQVWASGIASAPKDITVESLIRKNESSLENLADYQAFRGSNNSLVFGISPGVLAFRRPAMRQETARWAGQIRLNKTGNITPFLKEVTEEKGQILFAVDLRDAFHRDLVRPHLDSGVVSAYSESQRDRLATLIAGIQDVTLSIQVGETMSARVLFEFSEDVSGLGEAVKLVFNDILDQTGAAIEEFAQATVQTNGKYATLSTPFSETSLRQVLSLITISPGSNQPPGAIVAGNNSSNTQESALQADRTYFQAVDKMLNDLERSSRRSNNAGRIAVWHENFARRIDELPTQGVSPELTRFGADVSSKLRALSRSLQGQMVTVNAEQGTLTYDMQFQPGWASMNVWGGIGYGQPSYQVSSNLQQVRERQAAAISAGSDQRLQIWGMITDARGEALRQMVQKYGADFTSTSSRR